MTKHANEKFTFAASSGQPQSPTQSNVEARILSQVALNQQRAQQAESSGNVNLATAPNTFSMYLI